MEEYQNYPDTAKTWIYQSNQLLGTDEVNYLEIQIDDFISEWESHGNLLKATFKIIDNLFVVFFVDEQGDTMCGRAQDASVNLMKKLESELEVTFLDRMVQSYKKDGKINVVKMEDFPDLLTKKVIDEDTIVFNNMITNKLDFDNQWEVPLKDSWHKQFLV